jgi:DNA-binding PadR family transcriptional regulator
MATPVRLSQPTLKVLKFFLQKPRDQHSGGEISKLTGIGSGTLYPILARLEAARWFTSEWEDINPRVEGRPRRRFYKLTGLGQTNARNALIDLQIDTRQFAWTT